MKRISRNPEKFGALDLFSTIGREKGYSFDKGAHDQDFLSAIETSLQKGRKNPILLHGRRIETMFAYVAASLGNCVAIKQEDEGELYVLNPDIRQPDYRLALNDSSEFFVEVKNCHEKSPSKRFSLKKSYMESLTKYSAIFGHPLFIAIYWSSWNLWTLISVEHFPYKDDAYSINMLEAAKINEMAILGDITVGTTPPLELKFIADTSKPRAVDEKGIANFTIGAYEFYCNKNKITEKLEQNLAFYFMLYSDWVSSKPSAEIRGGNILSVTYTSSPESETPNQGFELMGSLSSMVSRQFNESTTSDRGVERFAPSIEPDSFGVIIPSEYKGKSLPLWRFIMKPNYEG